jgi:hypothetical protein
MQWKYYVLGYENGKNDTCWGGEKENDGGSELNYDIL